MLLPFFGAASKSDKGYIVVPDGCGAVINFNNKKGKKSIHSEYMVLIMP